MTDDLGMDDKAICGICGNSLQIVRPGKYQCLTCEIREIVQQKLFKTIDLAISRDGHHKSYEGATEVATRDGNEITVRIYGNRWKEGVLESTETFTPEAYSLECANEAPADCLLELHCYVLGGHRHYVYTARTEADCWVKLESDLALWRQEIESNYETAYEDSVFQYEWGGMKITQIVIEPEGDIND